MAVNTFRGGIGFLPAPGSRWYDRPSGRIFTGINGFTINQKLSLIRTI
jgi:hypothetical protein